jgi:hypothetical protein
MSKAATIFAATVGVIPLCGKKEELKISRRQNNYSTFRMRYIWNPRYKIRCTHDMAG